MKNTIAFLILTGFALTCCIFSCQRKPDNDETVMTTPPRAELTKKYPAFLITGGTILDGTGSPGYRGDLLVVNGRIAAIIPGGDTLLDAGTLPEALRRHGVNRIEAEVPEKLKVIDASGLMVTPGFIDAHAHGNPLSTPGFKNFLAMGVTTICLGQDGRSPESDSVSEWMDRVDSTQTGLGIVHFLGHATIRNRAGAPPVTGLQPDVLKKMQKMVENAMLEGSFGLSTGIEYRPGFHADMEELEAIAQPVALYDGLVMSHIRSEDDDEVEEAIEELLEQGRRSGARVHVSHLKVVYGKGKKRALEVLDLIHEARREGIAVTADLYPYAASYTGIGIVYPDWALPPNDFDSVRTHRREELRDYLHARVMLRNGPEATLFGTPPWAGRTLAEVADSLGKPFPDVLIDHIPPGSASAAYFVMDEDVIRGFLKDPLVMISSDGSPTMRHPRGYGSFARIIRQYVMEEEILSLEEAVWKMTGLTASTLGMDNPDRVAVPRGRIEAGFAADILLFDPREVRDKASFEDPHQLAEGMRWVLVNGIPVIENGEWNPYRAGGVIRRQPPM